MKIGLVHTTIRGDEKLLITSAKKLQIDLEVIDMRKQILNPSSWKDELDVVLIRCLSTTIGMHATSYFTSLGIPVVNNLEVSRVCVDKFATSLRLQKNNVATIPFAMVFTQEQALQAVDKLGGFPIVIKPTQGSWGRLLAKINDQDALEAVLEQKSVLGTPLHKAFYLQKYVEKPDRDIRVITVGDKVICAIYREAEHWIANTAKGARATNCKIDNDLKEISLAASNAVGGGVLGIDVFETDNGYVVNEINHTTEFKNVQRVTKVDVASEILSYCQKVYKNGKN